MTSARSLLSLTTLVGVREREVDRRKADMADMAALRMRYVGNISRLDALAQAPVPLASAETAVNACGYRQAVVDMANQHKQELAVHELDMEAKRVDLVQASRRCEVLTQVLVRQRQQNAKVARSKEQKRQDDIAAQVWGRSS
jgi:flagellar export protein FliJ